MVQAMDKAGFGNCTNQYECGAACPKEISVDWIAKFNRDFALATLNTSVTRDSGAGGGD
jgi:succinate dehydrogenase / fumarate reductase iron-sulfur subunit